MDELGTVVKQMPIPSGGSVASEFEHELADVFGVPYAVSVSAGTAALHAALSACGIGPGGRYRWRG
ncbi:DegT/DnrJ/EryC1/StrS family aminotransferase [Nocardia gamkensis]|uniref:DegT/DnrJ/EryC1/StrS family aminotransferase n=1 Tax=Nocardia gamkensis TaxID=352869 RepID=UPI0036DFD3AF